MLCRKGSAALIGALVLAAACSPPDEPVPSPPTTAPVTAAVDMATFVDDPCGLVDRDVLRRLGVEVEGFSAQYPGGKACDWEQGGALGVGLWVAVVSAGDPLGSVRGGSGVESVDVGGFAAQIRPGDREKYCQFHVETRPRQGLVVGFGAADGSVADPCGGVRLVAEGIAAKVRG
ncbi:DUF3558 family protein [Actinokineospora sp. NPDC004072]